MFALGSKPLAALTLQSNCHFLVHSGGMDRFRRSVEYVERLWKLTHLFAEPLQTERRLPIAPALYLTGDNPRKPASVRAPSLSVGKARRNRLTRQCDVSPAIFRKKPDDFPKSVRRIAQWFSGRAGSNRFGKLRASRRSGSCLVSLLSAIQQDPQPRFGVNPVLVGRRSPQS
jgi:hypothetical protein